MMKLNKSQVQQRDVLVAALQDQQEEVELAINHFNEQMIELFAAVEEAIESYNGTVRDAAEYVSTIAQDAESAFDERSERWQESERGERFREWVDEWMNVVLDEVQIEQPEEVDVPDLCAAETLENLPLEPGE